MCCNVAVESGLNLPQFELKGNSIGWVAPEALQVLSV